MWGPMSRARAPNAEGCRLATLLAADSDHLTIIVCVQVPKLSTLKGTSNNLTSFARTIVGGRSARSKSKHWQDTLLAANLVVRRGPTIPTNWISA